MIKINKNRFKEKGFTLIETIMYLALIGMVVSTFISFGLKVTEIRNKNYVVEEVQTSARSVMEFLTETIRQSAEVVFPVNGATSNNLELDLSGENDNLVLNVSDGVLYVALGANLVQYINNQETNITNLEFTNVGSDGERDSIKINLTIEFRGAASNDFRFTQSLETAVSVRL